MAEQRRMNPAADNGALLSRAHEQIGAMRTALIAAQTVIDAGVHPRTAALIEIALNYKPEDEDV